MMKFFLFLSLLIVMNQDCWADYIGTFKLISGPFNYSSESLTGSSMALGSPSVGFLKPINETHQIGMTFDVFFSVTSQSVSLYGLGVVYKYLIKGLGAFAKSESSDVTILTSTKWDLYALNSFKRYTYFLGTNKITETKFDQNGDFFNYDIGIGSSYDIGNHYRALAELSMTLFSFASSDNRIKFKSTLLTFGIQKEF